VLLFGRRHHHVLDVSLDVVRVVHLAVVNDGNSTSVDQKLLEVPPNVVGFKVVVVQTVFLGERADCRRTVGLEKSVERMFAWSVDIDSLGELKVRLKSSARTNELDTVEYFRSIFSRFLQTELVAGNSEDPEVPELGLQCIHWRILVSRTSERGYVHQHHHVATVTRPIDRLLSVHVIDLEVVDRSVAAARVITHHLVGVLVVTADRCHDNKQSKNRRHDGHQAGRTRSHRVQSDRDSTIAKLLV